jgi:hypothetical protein
MSCGTPTSQTHDWPLWWFARLQTAISRDDPRAAKEAHRNLVRLGVEVRFTLPPRQPVVARRGRHHE